MAQEQEFLKSTLEEVISSDDTNEDGTPEEQLTTGQEAEDKKEEGESNVSKTSSDELQKEEDKKLSRFERQRVRFEEQAAKDRAEIEFLRKMATGNVPQKQNVSVESDPAEPNIEDYNEKGIAEYLRDRDAHREDKLIKRAREEAAAQIEQQKAVDAWNNRVADARKTLKDWDEVMEAAKEDEVLPTEDTVEFITGSDVGPFIAHHLAKNPDEHERLKKLSPIRRVAELGKLEDKLSKGNKVEAKSDPKKLSNAPAPMATVKGNVTTKSTDTAAAARTGDYKVWKAAETARLAQLKKK